MTDEAEKEIARLRTIIDCYAASSAAAAAELKRLRAAAHVNWRDHIRPPDAADRALSAATDEAWGIPDSGKWKDPVAFAVVSDSREEIDCEFVYPDAATAGDVALETNGGVVPLYRHQQHALTDAEREAVAFAAERLLASYVEERGIALALRGLLERL